MNDLYIFNPENDVALANDGVAFTAPKNAVLFRECCSPILSWIADENDYIFVHKIPSHEWIEQIKNTYNICTNFVSDLNEVPIRKIIPWGWSNALKKELIDLGVDDSLLPSERLLAELRQKSHRRTSIEINQSLRHAGIDVPTLAVEATSKEEIAEYKAEHQRVVLKAPWSSSGRGVVDSALLGEEMFFNRALGVIRHQGSVIIEKFLHRVLDFAMLFEIQETEAKFVGFSRFINTRTGSYSANIVSSQEKHQQEICRYISLSLLQNVKEKLTEILHKTLGGIYGGYCGIDMMIYMDNSGKNRLAPCIELNLRNTMGIIASKIERKVDVKDKTFALRTLYYNNKTEKPQTPPIIRLTPQDKFEIGLYELD